MNRCKMFTGLLVIAMNVQAGILKGSIIDKQTREPLIGASVQIKGTGQGTVTDLDGNYELRLPDGQAYDLEARYVSYKSRLLRRISVEGELIHDIEMEQAALALNTVEVVARRNFESETALLRDQRTSVLATQAVGAKELSRKGVGDAEGAVQKVSGISKQDGVKNVFIRGLGDRYNATLLNGFPIPSEDPEYKNISLSFFDTDIIQSISVNKVFAANYTADATGAVIDIRSKELIGNKELEAKGSFGINTQTVSQPFLLQDGVNYLGTARTMPLYDDMGRYAFTNRLTPQSIGFAPDHSYGVAGGRSFHIGRNNDPLTFYILANYSSDNAFTDEIVRNTNTVGDTIQDQSGRKYTRNITQMLLGNIHYAFDKKHSITYNLMLIHAGRQYVADFNGMSSFFDDYHYSGFLRRQQANDNLLVVNQLHTSWTLAPKWTLDAGVAYNYMAGNEPDRRINYLSETDKLGIYTPTMGTGAQQRYFSDLTENDANLRIEAAYRLPDRYDRTSVLRFGYAGRWIDDNFQAIEYDMAARHTSALTLDNLNLDDFFNQEALDNGHIALDRNIDRYRVTKRVNAAYAEATYRLAKSWTMDLGLRMEHVLLQVDYNVNRGGTQGSGNINRLFWLPSLNLKYDITPKHGLRLGVSKTYTLPQAKEISPFRYVDVNFKSQGNPDLKPSDNYNVDLKWDFYPSPDELISAGLFYKYIANPIARIEVASAGGYLSYENISDKATVAGMEIELRKRLLNYTAGKKQHKLNLGLNGAYTYTCAKVGLATVKDGSRLEGAAPFIANADLSYQYDQGQYGFTGTVVCNYFSDRVYTIGTQGFQDIMEKGYPTLDIVLAGRLTEHFSLNLKVKNLTDSSCRLVRNANGGGEVLLSSYKKGIDISLGLTYKL